MDLNSQLIFAFALATLGETLTPGPTLGLVFESKLSATKAQIGEMIAGITLANIIWVAVAILIVHTGNTWFDALAKPIIIYFGTAYLIYLASRRLLSSTVMLITNTDEINPTAQQTNNYFLTGFMAHFSNPLTIAYYATTYGLATIGQTFETKMVFGFIAISADLIIYALIGYFTYGDIEKHFRRPIFRFLAGFALFYLVAHTYTSSSPSVDLSITPETMIIMLIGFLLAAIFETSNQVKNRINKDNKMLWRIAKLWSVWFSVFAVVGAFYSLVSGASNSLIKLDDHIELYIRICIIFSTVLALSLSFLKAYGEIQDEQQTVSKNIEGCPVDCWQSSPLKSCLASFLLLVGVFILLWVSGFKIQ